MKVRISYSEFLLCALALLAAHNSFAMGKRAPMVLCDDPRDPQCRELKLSGQVDPNIEVNIGLLYEATNPECFDPGFGGKTPARETREYPATVGADGRYEVTAVISKDLGECRYLPTGAWLELTHKTLPGDRNEGRLEGWIQLLFQGTESGVSFVYLDELKSLNCAEEKFGDQNEYNRMSCSPNQESGNANTIIIDEFRKGRNRVSAEIDLLFE